MEKHLLTTPMDDFESPPDGYRVVGYARGLVVMCHVEHTAHYLRRLIAQAPPNMADVTVIKSLLVDLKEAVGGDLDDFFE